jgi:hypothetical protein
VYAVHGTGQTVDKHDAVPGKLLRLPHVQAGSIAVVLHTSCNSKHHHSLLQDMTQHQQAFCMVT